MQDEYHHYIPTFVLRRFKLPNPSTPLQKSNRKRRGQKRPEIDNQEAVHFYDLGTGKLEIHPIAKVYGITNLYKDTNSPENVRRLEEKLSVLEKQVASVIGKIHDALGGGSFQIERRDLDALRKFIQITCYRKQAFYFDEDHPDNILCPGFLKYLRESKGLENGTEVWIRFLDYFLNTSHNDIINRAAEYQKKESKKTDSMFSLSGLLRSIFGSWWPSSVTVEDFIADDYNHLAGHFYLGVIEAAPGTEFIMSKNSFGLWEGMIGQLPEAHRLFIVSPRIALILRSNLLEGGIFHVLPLVVYSPLIDIPLKRAQVRYADGRQYITMEELLHHQVPPTGDRDQVKFKITKLTKQQTQNVNTTILFCASRDGSIASITFLSKGIMLKTLEDYMRLDKRLLAMTQGTYVALMDQLSGREISSPSSWHIGTDSATRRLNGLGLEPHDSSELGNMLPETHLYTVDRENKRINAVLDDISSGKISCKSDYDRAYQVYWGATMEEDAGQYLFTTLAMLLPVVIERVFRLKAEEIKPRNNIIQVNPFTKLVETLPAKQSAKVMSAVKALIADIPLPPYRDSEINDVLYGAIIVGLLHGFTMELSFVFPALFPGISLLQ